jgi:hypothetical protein
MTRQWQARRGTTTEHSSFTGAEGELTVNTTDNRVVVHDGVTVGGAPAAKASELAALTTTVNDIGYDLYATKLGNNYTKITHLPYVSSVHLYSKWVNSNSHEVSVVVDNRCFDWLNPPDIDLPDTHKSFKVEYLGVSRQTGTDYNPNALDYTPNISSDLNPTINNNSSSEFVTGAVSTGNGTLAMVLKVTVTQPYTSIPSQVAHKDFRKFITVKANYSGVQNLLYSTHCNWGLTENTSIFENNENNNKYIQEVAHLKIYVSDDMTYNDWLLQQGVITMSVEFQQYVPIFNPVGVLA